MVGGTQDRSTQGGARIEEGAYADILIIDGNLLEDFSVVGTGDKWFGAEPRPESPETIRIIMKDGKIYKNTLEAM